MKKQIPILFTKPEDISFFTPKDYINHLKDAGKEIPQVPCYVIIVYNRKAIMEVARKLKKIKAKWFTFDLYSLEYKGMKIGICLAPIEASSCGIMIEELAALGAKYFITIGSAGALQKKIKVGDFILSTGAIRDEGVSYQYMLPSKYVWPSKKLNRIIRRTFILNKLRFIEGYTWTTDAFYRETVKEVKKYRKEGVLCVDMEAATLFAIANFLKKDLSALFYISDTLIGKHWTLHFEKTRKILFKRLLRVALDAFFLLDLEKARLKQFYERRLKIRETPSEKEH